MGTSLYDSPTGSAISSLLQQLTGGQPQPTPAIAPPPAQSPSLLQRVVSNLRGLPAAIAHGVSEIERPQMPGEYQAAIAQGLLTPQEAEAARPSFLQSLRLDHQPGGSQEAYRQGLDRTIGINQAVQGIMQQRALENLRKNDQVFEPQPGETTDQMLNRWRAHGEYLMKNGDIDGGLKVMQAVHDAEPQRALQGPQKREPMRITGVIGAPGGAYAGKPVTRLVDPDTYQVVGEIPEFVRPPRNTLAPDMPIARQITTVRGQIAQTQHEIDNANHTAQSAGLLADEPTRQRAAQATASISPLTARLDSLSRVLDSLAAVQQGNPTPGRGGLPRVTNPSVAPSPYSMSTDQSAAMQREMDEASTNLKAILNSSAPDNVKAQARRLYDQQQQSIARKYGAVRQ